MEEFNTYRICVPMHEVDEEFIDLFNMNMKQVLYNICEHWDRVDFLDDRIEGRVMFRDYCIELRPPFRFIKNRVNYMTSRSYLNEECCNGLGLEYVKMFSSKFYKECTRLLGVDFDMYISVDFDTETDFDL